MLRQLPQTKDPRLLVGSSTADDAGVYRLDAKRALVQTVDFFTPIVDDPYLYGQIAAANSLSDVYAMGGRPLTALNIVGMPDEDLPPEVIARILIGGSKKAKEAHCLIVGGHSIKNPEPIYGLSVTGLVHPKRMITNAQARPGDWLVLTKPLGTGIIATGIKRELASLAVAKRAANVMRKLNDIGAALAETSLVRAGTDVTGFGLLGHLGALCRASNVGARIDSLKVPVIAKEVWNLIEQGAVPGGTKANLRSAESFTEFHRSVPESRRLLLADAQTSGGLLCCVQPNKLESALETLARPAALCATVIGRIVAGAPAISVT